MEDRNTVRVVDHDTIFELVIPLLTDSRDRDALSLVCKRCWEIDRITRKRVTVALCYTATPRLLSRRFPHLESLKLKGKPRAAMFNLIPEDWGGYASPWVLEITSSFTQLKFLHFRRMIVTDADLQLLASARGRIIEVLELDKCSGFSTNGLLHITRSCRNLRTLFLEDSQIVENDGEWVTELSLRNSILEVLNFYMTDLVQVRVQDLELIARNCPRLVSLKISECDILELTDFYRAATALEEFGGGSFSFQPGLVGEDGVDEQPGRYAAVTFPPRLHRLGLTYLGNAEMSIIYPIAGRLKKLDLLYALLDTEGHCALLSRCPNLEILEARNVIGDRGLQVVAESCLKLKRIRIERGEDEQGMEDEEGTVSHRGLIALARGCLELEYVAIYVSDINNEALECIGRCSKNMCDFRLVLLEREEKITDLPLDNGVRRLLMGCKKLRRFALYLRKGGLTDTGLNYIGLYSQNVRWMLLGFVGETDDGLIQFSRGCPSLQKLEMRGCCFSERAIAIAVSNLNSLKYLWVQGYAASGNAHDLSPMVRPFWNIELIPPRKVPSHGANGEEEIAEHPAHILAYYSLAGHRTDFPDSVVPFTLSWSIN